MKFLFLFCILATIVLADHLKCRQGLIDFYKYDSTITGIGKEKEEMKVEAGISMTCLKVVRIDGVEAMVMLMENTNVKIYHKGKHQGSIPYDRNFEKPLTFIQTRTGDILRLIHGKDEPASVISMKKSMLANFVVKMAGHTGVEMTQVGKVKFSYEKSITREGLDVIMKKAVEVLEPADKAQKPKDAKYDHVSYIQVNTDGKIHRISSQVGSKIGKSSDRQHRSYEKEKVKVGQEEHADDYKSNPQAANAFNFGSETIVNLVKTGHYGSGSVSVDEHRFGKSVPRPRGQASEGSADGSYEGSGSYADGSNEGSSSFAAEGSADGSSEGASGASTLEIDEENTLSIKDIEDSLDDDQQSSTMGLDERVISEAREHTKALLRREVDFPSVLSRIRENTKNNNLLAHAHDYVAHLGDEALEHVVNEWKQLSFDDAEHLDYGNSLLSMFTVAQTDKGQEHLIQAMGHHATVQQAVINTVSLRNPSDRIIEELRTISMKDKIHGLDDVRTMDIKTNAYFAYAHSGSKVGLEKSHVILSEVTRNLENVKNVQDFEMQVHALANLGDSAPLEALAVLATNEQLPLELRTAAIDGLGNRVQEHNSMEVTNLLHHLTEKQFNEAVRTHAVSALTRRESEMQNAASVQFLTRYLEDPKTPSTMVQAIKNYLLEVSTDESHRILDHTKLGDQGHIGERHEAVKVMAMEGYFDRKLETLTLEAKPLFFRRIGRFFRRVGRRIAGGFRKAGAWIKKTAKKVGSAIVKAAKTVYKKTIGAVVEKVKKFMSDIKKKFSKAQFKGEKICVTSSAKGDRLCMYDQSMVAFVRKQGDISMMKFSKQFAFEKLLGVEIMHVYVGFVGYAGTRIDCETNSFDIVIFGRGEAKAKLFNRNVLILAAELELNKRTDAQLHDKAYLRIMGVVLFNKPFVPDNIRNAINMCDKTSRPLVNPIRKTLVQFSFQLVIVVVPLTFRIAVTGELGVDLVNIVCPGRLTLTASIEPYVGLGIQASAGIGFAILSGGVRADFDSNYRLQPGFGTSNCNLCAVLDHTVRPISIGIFLEARVLGKKWDTQLYRFNGPTIKGNLFKLCLFPNKPYNPDSVLGAL